MPKKSQPYSPYGFRFMSSAIVFEIWMTGLEDENFTTKGGRMNRCFSFSR